MWPPRKDKPYARVTSDGRTIVDQSVLLSSPKVQADIERIAKMLHGAPGVRELRLTEVPK